MRVVITGGPSSEPIDRVRTLTNRSTGELAVKLSKQFADHGNEVELFLGAGATWRDKEARFFETNEELEALLEKVREKERVDALFHAAALSDFRVKEIKIIGGGNQTKKIPSDAESIQIDFVRKPKLINRLRGWFPKAYLVGWKFELDGTQDEIIKKGLRQIRQNRTDACIVNGEGFGVGFGLCLEKGLIWSGNNRDELAVFLWEHISSLQERNDLRLT